MAAAEGEAARLRRYTLFLDAVLEAAAAGARGVVETFAEPRDVLVRYETLRSTNADLHAAAEEGRARVEALRVEAAALAKRSHDAASLAHTRAQDGEKRLASAVAGVADAAMARDATDAERRERRGVGGRTLACIANLYARTVATAPANSLPTVLGAWGRRARQGVP